MKSKFLFRNRKIKFSESDYIERHYIRNGKAIIPVELNSMDDLFMKHDYRKIELSDSICKYIEEIAYIIPLKYDIILEIHCPHISEEEQERVRKIFKNNYGMEIDDRDYDVKIANQKSGLLFILGMILLVISITLENKIPEFLQEFVYIAGWVALWEMFESFFLITNTKRAERLNHLQLYDSEITFIFDK